MSKISVCMAVHNGQKYLKEQIDSILSQLALQDELVISDDGSADSTLTIIKSYGDKRLKLFKSTVEGDLIRNFENALAHSTGDIIFLSDQDDVWSPHKIKVMTEHLKKYDLVLCDGLMVNEDLSILKSTTSLFERNRVRRGLLRNIWKNGYMGCCMAFKRNLLNKALPFPIGIPMHDQWLGLIGELYFRPVHIKEQLVYYRRHASTMTMTGHRSNNNLLLRMTYRFNLVKNIIRLYI